MPHVIAEYSANLEGQLDMTAFCQHLRRAAEKIDAFPMPGLRVRALKADHFAIADGADHHGFIDISVRLRAGRSDAVKADIAEQIFEAARTFTADHMETRSLALSLEVRDIDPAFSRKFGTIRDHLETSK